MDRRKFIKTAAATIGAAAFPGCELNPPEGVKACIRVNGGRRIKYTYVDEVEEPLPQDFMQDFVLNVPPGRYELTGTVSFSNGEVSQVRQEYIIDEERRVNFLEPLASGGPEFIHDYALLEMPDNTEEF